MEIHDDEKKVLTDHNYDGIQELDNALPPWWKNLFYLTIIFAVVYYVGMQHAGWFLQQEGEYAADVAYHEKLIADAEAKELAAEKAAQGDDADAPNVGATSVVVVKGPSPEDVKAGKAIYLQNCAACHLPDGGGLVGPNLTDNFWINGDGSLDAIKAVVAVGVPAKGMIAWKPVLGKKKWNQVSAYVFTLKGTVPAKAKAAEGKEYLAGDVTDQVVVKKEKPLSPEAIAAGKKIFTASCVACHLADGGGLIGPNLTDNFWISGKGSLADIISVVTKGVPAKGMIAWGPVLGKKKIKQVSSFIKSLKGTKPAKPKAAEGKEYLGGDVTEKVVVKKEKPLSPKAIAAGKKIFAASCVACHLADGGGLIGPNLTDNFWISGKGSLADIISVVTKGVPAKGMIAWGPVLGRKKVKQVSSFIKSLKGTKPAKPKAPEGNEVLEDGEAGK